MLSDWRSLAHLSFLLLKNRMLSSIGKHPFLMILFFIGALALYYGYVAFCFKLMLFIYQQPIFGEILAARLIYVLFFLSLVIGVMSSLTTSVSLYYMSKDLEYQFAFPVNFGVWVSFRYLQVFTQTNWVLIVFGSPLLVAYIVAIDGNVLAIILSMMVFIALSSYPVSLASLFCILLVKIFPPKRMHQVLLVSSIILISSMILLFRYMEPETFIGPGGLEKLNHYLDVVSTNQQSLNPAQWATQAVVALANKQYGDGLSYASYTLTAGGALFLLFFAVSHKYYRRSWDRALQALSGETDSQKEFQSTSHLLMSGRWNQVIREIKLFVRDPSQWSQSFVMIALLVMYLFSIAQIPLELLGGNAYLAATVNQAFVSFVTLAVANRFVFPSFSTDGYALWLTQMAPSGWRSYVVAKIIVYVIPIVLFSLVLSGASSLILGVAWADLTGILAACLWDSLFIMFLSFCLGIYWLTPGIENPLKLTLSAGGVLLLVGGLFVVGFHLLLRVSTQSVFLNQQMSKFGWPDFQDGMHLYYYAAVVIIELLVGSLFFYSSINLLRQGRWASQ